MNAYQESVRSQVDNVLSGGSTRFFTLYNEAVQVVKTAEETALLGSILKGFLRAYRSVSQAGDAMESMERLSGLTCIDKSSKEPPAYRLPEINDFHYETLENFIKVMKARPAVVKSATYDAALESRPAAVAPTRDEGTPADNPEAELKAKIENALSFLRSWSENSLNDVRKWLLDHPAHNTELLRLLSGYNPSLTDTSANAALAHTWGAGSLAYNFGNALIKAAREFVHTYRLPAKRYGSLIQTFRDPKNDFFNKDWTNQLKREIEHRDSGEGSLIPKEITLTEGSLKLPPEGNVIANAVVDYTSALCGATFAHFAGEPVGMAAQVAADLSIESNKEAFMKTLLIAIQEDRRSR